MICLNLSYANGKYKIKIEFASNSQILNLLNNIYQIEKYDLEVEKKNIEKAFPISEKIELSVILFKNDGFICKNKKDEHIKIKYQRRNYYLKFSISGRKEDKFILSFALVVFYEYNKILYPLFRAFKNIFNDNPNPILRSIDYPDTSRINESKIFQNQFFPKKVEINSRSKSFNQSFLKFNKKDENFKEKDLNYSFSQIKNINELTKSITNNIFGLFNLGNTCFLNSSLQILIHSPFFIQKFLEDIYKFKPSKDTVVYEFFNLIMNINSNNKKVFSPEKLISSFLKKCHIFSLGEQSDSQRFYRNLATIFEKEFGLLNTCIKNTFMGEFENTMYYYCSSSFCRISQQNTVNQSFYDIFISVPEKETTIIELINKTYEIKKIESSKKCKCKNNLEFIRVSKIKPNIYLSVNIQRGKIETRTLKNTSIIIDIIKLEEKLYEPYAINFHTGTMDSGHYYR